MYYKISFEIKFFLLLFNNKQTYKIIIKFFFEETSLEIQSYFGFSLLLEKC